VNVVNVVDKYGADDRLERSWELPDTVISRLRGLVEVGAEGWIAGEWPFAAVVQPFVDELVEANGSWFVGSRSLG
jgi:hypothetical protein